MNTLGSMGEFPFIDRVSRMLPLNANVLIGAGDDCAVLRCGDKTLLATCDLSIEGVHFVREDTSAEDLGWKVLAVSLSDIAAMGGVPRFALVSLAAPSESNVAFLDGVYRGLVEAAGFGATAIVGGDTTRSPGPLIFDTVVIGEAPQGRYLTRAGAREGDKLVVTGYPGRSAAGLHALKHRNEEEGLLRAHRRPLPRLREGLWLLGQESVHAMIDVSDGVAQDAGHLARPAGLGIAMAGDRAPLAEDLTIYCNKHEIDARELLLTGGEDYELAFAVDKANAEEIVREFAENFQIPATIIGEFSRNVDGVVVDGKPLPHAGFDHFRRT